MRPTAVLWGQGSPRGTSTRVPSKRKAMLRNMVSALLEHERIETTLPKAKMAQAYAERMITLAKSWLGLDVPTLATGKSGRANVDSIAMSQQLADVLNADVVDRRELCIKRGSFVWIARLDVYCLDHSGSVFM